MPWHCNQSLDCAANVAAIIDNCCVLLAGNGSGKLTEPELRIAAHNKSKRTCQIAMANRALEKDMSLKKKKKKKLVELFRRIVSKLEPQLLLLSLETKQCESRRVSR